MLSDFDCIWVSLIIYFTCYWQYKYSLDDIYIKGLQFCFEHGPENLRAGPAHRSNLLAKKDDIFLDLIYARHLRLLHDFIIYEPAILINQKFSYTIYVASLFSQFLGT